MPKTEDIPKFSLSWTTLSHDEHPYGDILWHLFWGIVIGFSILYAIISKDFLYLVISLIALFFFFHPIFYEEKELKIKIDQTGIYVDEKKYNWEDIIGFEILKIKNKVYLYFIPKHIFAIGPIIPFEDYISYEEVRKILRQFLDEYENSVALWEIIYRKYFQ